MNLYIDTISDNCRKISIKIIKNKKSVFEKIVDAEHQQSEKLLVTIDNLIKKNKINLNEIKEVEVLNSGGSFTALRIGVVTANALGYALGIPVRGASENSRSGIIRKDKFSVVKPIYSREPNITTSKKSL